MAVQIEIDLFSGRVNPRWTLSTAEAGELRAAVAGLAASVGEGAAPPDLGYRGFRVADGDILTIVYGGSVRRRGRVWADPGRAVELWLLRALPAELADLRAVIAAQWS